MAFAPSRVAFINILGRTISRVVWDKYKNKYKYEYKYKHKPFTEAFRIVFFLILIFLDEKKMFVFFTFYGQRSVLGVFSISL